MLPQPATPAPHHTKQLSKSPYTPTPPQSFDPIINFIPPQFITLPHNSASPPKWGLSHPHPPCQSNFLCKRPTAHHTPAPCITTTTNCRTPPGPGGGGWLWGFNGRRAPPILQGVSEVSARHHRWCFTVVLPPPHGPTHGPWPPPAQGPEHLPVHS